MKGVLVVNSFINSQKFNELYTLLYNSFLARGVGLDIKKTADFCLPLGERIKTDYDFCIFWDKDIPTQKRLEEVMPVFNSSQSTLLCDDKVLTYEVLSKNGLPIPKTIIAPKTFEGINYCDDEFIKKSGDILGYPMIIKEAFGSFGKQVYLANNYAEAVEIIKSVNYKPIILQQFIKESSGKDIRVNVVGGKVVCAIKRENKDDFRSNITNGGTGTKIDIDKSLEALAIESCIVLGLDYGGVDIMKTNTGYAICEVNSNPHFKSAYDVTGVNLADHIADYIIQKIN